MPGRTRHCVPVGCIQNNDDRKMDVTVGCQAVLNSVPVGCKQNNDDRKMDVSVGCQAVLDTVSQWAVNRTMMIERWMFLLDARPYSTLCPSGL